jgi:hypothetical protein
VSSPSARRQKKRAQREQEKRARRAQKAVGGGAAGKVRRAARWPIMECRISADFRTTGIAEVIVARESEGEVGLLMLFVDLGCLGVKECVVEGSLEPDQYRELVQALHEENPLVECTPELAAKVVAAAVRHGESLGFRPSAAFALAREMLAGIDPEACAEEISCGRDGKPFYIAGADDDVGEVLRRLEGRLGPDGFRFLLPDEGFGDLRPAQDDWPREDDPDPAERTFGRLRRAEDSVVTALLRHALTRHGRALIAEARAEYEEGAVEPEAGAPRVIDGFLHWFLLSRPMREKRRAPPRSLGLEFLAERGAQLSDFERRFLEEACRHPFSFHAVTSFEPGKSLSLRDLLTGRETTLREQRTETELELGSVLYARIVTLDAVSLLVGLEPHVLPFELGKALDGVRQHLAGGDRLLSEEELRGHDAQLRILYRALLAGLRGLGEAAPAPPAGEVDPPA